MISTSIVLPRVAPSPRFFRRVSSAVGAQSVLEVLTSRGLVHDVSSRPELSAALARPPLTFYIGLDPTANSLHVGHLLPVVVARHLQRAGHRPIMVIGGATGRIGDPTGRSLERQLLDLSETDANASRLEKLAAHLLRLPPDGPPNLLPALVVNNLSWFSSINALDFLRDVGGHFRVSKMLARDSVKKRLESATDGGLSFLELSYQLFQAYDFVHLHRTYGCTLQIGGSDQWGNIVAGLELLPRVAAGSSGAGTDRCHGLTVPLMVGSDGNKLGKSAGNTDAAWITADRTPVFDLYQYFMRLPDADAVRLLPMLTFLDLKTVGSISQDHARAPEQRLAQRALAREIVQWVHGDAEAAAAEQASLTLYGAGSAAGSSVEAMLSDPSVPRVRLPHAHIVGARLVDLCVAVKLAESRNEAKQLIAGRGLSLNGAPVTEAAQTVVASDLLGQNTLLLRAGRRRYVAVQVE